MNNIPQYQFRKTKYGSELLIDLIRLESLETYIRKTPRHSLTYYDITLIDEGAGRFAIDEHEFEIEKNRLYFTAPNQIREWKVDKIPTGMVLIFEEEFLCNFFNDALFVQNLSFFGKGTNTPQMSISTEQGDYLRNIMVQIEHEIHSYISALSCCLSAGSKAVSSNIYTSKYGARKDYTYPCCGSYLPCSFHENKETHLLRALLYQALAWLNNIYLSQCPPMKEPHISKSVQFRQLVDQHFSQEHSVAFYAGQLCITPGHLNDLVRKESGTTAKQFIINRLTTEAKRLLLYSELPVSEIAWKLGYTDPSYFVRLFRNETGSSPLTFRYQKKYTSPGHFKKSL